jgi:hypothetical protein
MFTVACLGTLVFSCVPPSASWRPELKATAKCFTIGEFTAVGLFNSAINAFTDLAFATLPIPLVLQLQVNTRSKLSLCAILCLGIFACIASLVKITYQVRILSEPDGLRYNMFNIWNAVELFIGIIAACLPTLRPLVKSILDSTRSWSAWSRPSGTQRSGYGTVNGKGASKQRASMLRQSRGVKTQDEDSQELTQFSFSPTRDELGAKETEARVRIEAFSRSKRGSDESIVHIPEGAIVKTTDFAIH